MSCLFSTSVIPEKVYICNEDFNWLQTTTTTPLTTTSEEQETSTFSTSTYTSQKTEYFTGIISICMANV